MIDKELFFNEIAKRWILSEKAENQFIFLGFKPEFFPECKSKKILLKYLDIKKKHTMAAARSACYSDAESLCGEELPSDSLVLKHKYFEIIERQRYLDLSTMLSRNPSDGKRIISLFLSQPTSEVVVKNLKDSIEDIFKRNDERVQKKENLISLKNWPLLSEGIGGFNTSRVSLLVAGTGVGKTTIAINLALSAIESGLKVLYINQEMCFDDIGARVIESGANITHKEWNSGVFNYENLGGFVNKIKKADDFYLTNGRALTLNEISATIMAFSLEAKKLFVVVDYDQKIISESHEEEWQMLRRAIEHLEDVSKHTNSHIMVLAQGDDAGDPKASKRSKQAAATVLHFGKNENNIFYIKAHKNRFGEKDFAVEVIYDPSRARAKEGRKLTDDDFVNNKKQEEVNKWKRFY